MYRINDDLSIYVTRGDGLVVNVKAEVDGKAYTFQPRDVVRFKVCRKKNCDDVVLDKSFTVGEDPTTEVQVFLDSDDTKIGKVISKPVDYWYEVEVTTTTEDGKVGEPQTIIGYDENGPKIFRLYPEAGERSNNE